MCSHPIFHRKGQSKAPVTANVKSTLGKGLWGREMTATYSSPDILASKVTILELPHPQPSNLAGFLDLPFHWSRKNRITTSEQEEKATKEKGLILFSGLQKSRNS